MTARPKPRILVVEDDDDAREMLLAFLSTEGYDALGTITAEQGLGQLRAGGFGLIITDHRLPGKTGAWLLEEAQRAGLLQNVGALLWSADPDPHCVEGIKVLKKPVDLDRLLFEIEKELAAARGPELEVATESRAAPFAEAQKVPVAEVTELVLYVTDSLTSRRAMRNLEHALSMHDASELRLRICDLTKDPLAGVTDRVAFTPMLIRMSPLPRESLLGDLRHEEDVHQLLRRVGAS